MERTTIPKGTLRFALAVLDKQREFSATHGKTQLAYYQGLRDMLDIVLSDAHSVMRYVECDAAGHHTVPEKDNPA